jgi:hypothetical protein
MKPKENTIDKIDTIFKALKRHPCPLFNLSLAESLQQRCHSMNIHKAKVVYFKRIKLILTQALELSKKYVDHPARDLSMEFEQVEREIRALLDARNG